MSDLYLFNEVPDPDGQLTDLLEELIDNGALTVLDPTSVLDLWVLRDVGPEWEIDHRATVADVLAALTRKEPTNGH